MTRNPGTRPRWAGFPDLANAPEECAELLDRWGALLERAPRLRPWLLEMLAQRRARLQQSAAEAAAANIERALWGDLARWVVQFEALPQFTVSAIATTLQGEERPGRAEPPPGPSLEAAPDSPERAVGELEALLSDPVFALAFHCVETRIRPSLPAFVPQAAWFGLLHASAAPQPLLTPDVAVTLVLRVLGAAFLREPATVRGAALRLFHATAADLRARGVVDRLCAALPWTVDPTQYVEAAKAARGALAEACALCGRFAAAVKARRGSFAVLQPAAAEPPSPAEVAELARTARNYEQMEGFRRLLSLL